MLDTSKLPEHLQTIYTTIDHAFDSVVATTLVNNVDYDRLSTKDVHDLCDFISNDRSKDNWTFIPRFVIENATLHNTFITIGQTPSDAWNEFIRMHVQYNLISNVMREGLLKTKQQIETDCHIQLSDVPEAVK